MGAAWTGLPAPARAEEPATSREAIEEIIRDYLLQHPEVVTESLRRAEEQRRDAAHRRAQEVVRTRREELLHDPGSPVGGNPAGTVTVVEFFDYRCPHCRRMAPVVRALAAEDATVRLVFKEWPILGEESVIAARAALAAAAQGRYVEAHDRLMRASGPLTAPRVVQTLVELGLDEARLRRDMEGPEVAATITRAHALAQTLGLDGTPAFVVGDDVIMGAVDLDTLRTLVARARQGR
jgi:protein-disulfide isomerase